MSNKPVTNHNVMKKLIYIIVATLMLASCSTTKKVQRATEVKTDPSRQLIEQVIAVQPAFTAAQAAKARFSINYAQHNYNISGSINMLTDSAIILSLQPILGIELYRMELMPQTLTIIDKMNRRYVRMTYQQLQQQTGLNIGFSDIQALCMNHMFVAGSGQERLTQVKADTQTDAAEYRLTFSDDMLNYCYTVDRQSLQLLKTDISMTGKPYVAAAEYTGHQLWGNTIFPEKIKIIFGSSSVEGSCTITFQQLVFNDKVNVAPQNLSRYAATTLNAIIH